MTSILNFEILYVVALIIVQFMLQTLVLTYVMKKKGLLKFPIAGLEYSQGVFVSFLVLGGYLIGLASINSVFETVKSAQHAGDPVYFTVFIRFARFFFVILVLYVLYWVLVLFSAKLFLGFKNPFEEIIAGNLPAAFLMSGMALGYALLLYFLAAELIELITPKFLVFN